nr:glycosyltransferase family 4 protein [Alteraurantiacibacter buctensis]
MPRRCGIATFTDEVARSLGALPSPPQVDIYALTEPDCALEYGAIAGRVSPHDRAAVRNLADQINASGADAVWIQHEFGIFGGPDGETVVDLAQALAAPLLVTFHTVLRQPSDNQRRIVRQLLARASRVMVMTRSGRELLIAEYGARPQQVVVIPHGAPDRPFIPSPASFADGSAAPQLMTFGLIGPGKGLETAIAALPAIRARYPDVRYRIVGMTHPTLLAREGETYRESLIAQARELGVEDNINWDNRFLETDDLLDQLQQCDVYLTPYPNLQQSTSGTLSFAVALGKAVVSTPYEHARELLGDGAGVLVPPGDAAAMANGVLALLDDPEFRQGVRQLAYQRGRETLWSVFGRRSLAMVKEAVSPAPYLPARLEAPGSRALWTLCDGTGMLQHGVLSVPDRTHGYCIDDNARALIAMHDGKHLPMAERRRWSVTFASFIQHAWNDGEQAFRNFMSYDRSWCEERGSEDSYGRTLWALGATAERALDDDLRLWGRMWFDRALRGFAAIDSPRALALAAQGAASILRTDPQHRGAQGLLERTGDMLTSLLAEYRRPSWPWFEAVLAYDNPRLPLAMILAGECLERSEWTRAGLDTLGWISQRQTGAQGQFRPVGSEGFGQPGVQLPFDQQPLEAQAMIEAAGAAWKVTRDCAWRTVANRAWQWFFGVNDRGVMIADLASGRCRDGVTPRGANLNCGAESVLALHASYSAMAAFAGSITDGVRGHNPGGLDDSAASGIVHGGTGLAAA